MATTLMRASLVSLHAKDMDSVPLASSINAQDW